jgi:hypothetical protein
MVLEIMGAVLIEINIIWKIFATIISYLMRILENKTN